MQDGMALLQHALAMFSSTDSGSGVVGATSSKDAGTGAFPFADTLRTVMSESSSSAMEQSGGAARSRQQSGVRGSRSVGQGGAASAAWKPGIEKNFSRSDAAAGGVQGYASTQNASGQNAWNTHDPMVAEAVGRVETLIRDNVLSSDDIENLSETETSDLMAWVLGGAGGLFPPVAIETPLLAEAVSGAMQDVAGLFPTKGALAVGADLLGGNATDLLGVVGELGDDAMATLGEALEGVDTEGMSREDLAKLLEGALEEAGMDEAEGALASLPKPVLKALVRVFNHAEEAATARNMLEELSQRGAARGLGLLSAGKVDASAKTTETIEDAASLELVCDVDASGDETDTDVNLDVDGVAEGDADSLLSAKAGDDSGDRQEHAGEGSEDESTLFSEEIMHGREEQGEAWDPAAVTLESDMLAMEAPHQDTGTSNQNGSQQISSVFATGSSSQSAPVREAQGAQSYVDVQENIDRLSAALRVSIRNNVATAKIDLMPIDLGRVQVSLSVKNGMVHGTIQADSPEAARMLSANVGLLRNTLTDQGVQLGNLDVAYDWTQDGSNGSQQFADGQSGHQRNQHVFRDDVEDMLAGIDADGEMVGVEAVSNASGAYQDSAYVNTTA